MPVPQEVICLDDRELEHLTLQQPKQREKCDDTKTDMYTVFNINKGEGGGGGGIRDRLWVEWVRLRRWKDELATLKGRVKAERWCHWFEWTALEGREGGVMGVQGGRTRRWVGGS